MSLALQLFPALDEEKEALRRENLALRLENALLREQAKEDPLTGLHNHRAFERALSAEFARAQRCHRPLSLVILDVDHFKQVNDTHGHPYGDKVLRAVADCLRVAIRESDYAARPGGEEFALVLPETGMDGAALVAERVLELVRRNAGVTISAGIATWPDHAPGTEDLKLKADAALYRAKKAGRDRLELAL